MSNNLPASYRALSHANTIHNEASFAGLAFVAMIQVGVSAQSTRPRQVAVMIDVKGPMIIGFFPPFTKAEKDADDGGIREDLAHLQSLFRVTGNMQSVLFWRCLVGNRIRSLLKAGRHRSR